MISIYHLVKIYPVVLEKKMLTDDAHRTTTDGNPLAISHLRNLNLVTNYILPENDK